MQNLNFITASHDDFVLQNNLMRSTVFNSHHIEIMKDFTNIPEAYNMATVHSKEQKRDGLFIYVHHDVYLPPGFEYNLERFIAALPEDWEVAGVAGVTGPPKKNFGFICDRGKMWGKVLNRPVKVDTLDELLLITRGNIEFDPQFTQDFYGADICVGRKAYVLPLFVHHNSGRAFGGRTDAFYEAEERFRAKHFDKLPIVTTCAVVDKIKATT